MDSFEKLLKDRLVDEDSMNVAFVMLPVFVIRDSNLSHAAKLTYAALKMYARQKDSCFPGQETLAKDLNVSVRSIQRNLEELKKHNYLKVTRQGLNKPNVYTLLSTKQRWISYLEKQDNR